jgi:hypothetical protein
MTEIEAIIAKTAMLTEKAKEADRRVFYSEGKLTDLLVNGPEADLVRARADHQAAVIDRDALDRGVEDAENALTVAEEHADADRILENSANIQKLSKKRKKLLTEGEAAYMTFMDKVAAADQIAIEIRSVGAGARDLGNAINARVGNLGAWFVTRLIERFGSPELDSAIAGTIANHKQARTQLEGKTLADTDADFAELYRKHHSAKLEDWNDRAA